MITPAVNLPRWLTATLLIGMFGAAFWRAPEPAATAFATPPPASPSHLPALFAGEMLPREASSASHPNLAELPDGRIAAAWLAGPDDERVIRFSILEAGGWRQPLVVASRESTAGGAFAYVSSIDHPVLYAEGSWLHLWYASSTVGSSINHSVSTDGGKSWMKPTRLQTSPFANFGGEVHAPPVALADGGLGLPVSHDFFGRHGEWLHLSPSGEILDRLRLPAPAGALQPAVAALDEQRAIAVLRPGGDRPNPAGLATTSDGGRHWQATDAVVQPGPLAPNAPLALLRLQSGRLLLAGNPADGRQALLLWLSGDDGKTWQAGRSLEAATDGGAEFASPALLLGRDGRIHVAYEWRRQGIKHVVFSEAWLDGGAP